MRPFASLVFIFVYYYDLLFWITIIHLTIDSCICAPVKILLQAAIRKNMESIFLVSFPPSLLYSRCSWRESVQEEARHHECVYVHIENKS